jgi:Zinc finger, C3HC4 type (RING finger)
MNYCLVEGCRYPRSHVINGHRCLTCGNFGHGPRECGNTERITNLFTLSRNIVLPTNEYCTIRGCRFYYLHKTDGHCCYKCKNYGHAPGLCPQRNQTNQNISTNQTKKYTVTCPYCRKINNVCLEKDNIFGLDFECKICQENSIDIRLPVCKHAMCSSCVKNMNVSITPSQNEDTVPFNFTLNHPDQIVLPESSPVVTELMNNPRWHFNFPFDGTLTHVTAGAQHVFGLTPGKLLLCTDSGMGCQSFAKRDDINEPIRAFFMHGDSWGQYGPGTSDVESLNDFVNGEYTLIKNSLN